MPMTSLSSGPLAWKANLVKYTLDFNSILTDRYGVVKIPQNFD